MKFYIRLSPNDAESKIVMGDIPLTNVTRIEIEQGVMEIPRIRLDLALDGDVIIHGDATVSIGDLHVPPELAYKIYERLKEYFGKDRI